MATPKKKSKLPKILIFLFCNSGCAGFFALIILGAGVVVLPAAGVAWGWDRVSNWFDDHDWKNKVQEVSHYQIPKDRENLLLYRPIWMDCSADATKPCNPIPEDDEAHWMNFGDNTTALYRVPEGYHSYTFDIGREAMLDDITLLFACKDCKIQVYASYGANLTAEQVARYYDPSKGEIRLPLVATGRWAALNKIGEARDGARFITFTIHSNGPEAYVSQLLAFPPGATSNALWAAQPGFDGQYQAIYNGKVGAALGVANPLTRQPINSGDAQSGAKLSWYAPGVDANSDSYLPLYPVIGSPPQAGDGTAGDAVTGYQPIFLTWKLHPYTVGKVKNITLNWLYQYPSQVGQAYPPPPPYAKSWELYFLHSGRDAALLNQINSGANVSLPESALLKKVTNASSAPISTGDLVLPAGDDRDTLVFVFQQSSYTAPPAPVTFPGQLPGLPMPWLAPAEISVAENPPPKPKTPKMPGTYTSSGGGAFDVRFGSIDAAKIEEILKSYPYRGITANGYPAGNPPQPNILTGKGQFIVDMGKKYGINPAYALAWAVQETSMFTTGVTVYNATEGRWYYNGYNTTYNPATGKGGWLDGKCFPAPPLTGSDGVTRYFCGYLNPEDAIEDWFALISEGYVGGQLLGGRYGNLVTVDQIVGVYAPASDGNDVNIYGKNVKSLVTDWGALGGGGPVPAINQYDPSNYNSTYPYLTWKDSTCGPTSATMVLQSMGYTFGLTDTLGVAVQTGQISAVEGLYSWSFLNAPDFGAKYGFSYTSFRAGSGSEYLARWRELTAQGYPVIINVIDNYYFAGHFMVVVAYDGVHDTFTVNDPAARPISGTGVVQEWPASRLGNIVRIGSESLVIYKTSTAAPF